MTMDNTATTVAESRQNSGSKAPQRSLACVLCTRRKIKCDRNVPCANCAKAQVQCIASKAIPRRRRDISANRGLLEQVYYYEQLLHKHKIQFEPFAARPARRCAEFPHNDVSEEVSGPSTILPDGQEDETSSKARQEPIHAAQSKNILDTVSQSLQDSHSVQNQGQYEMGVKKAWAELFEDNESLLFGIPRNAIEIIGLHPEPFQILQVWQHFLDNVNPLLKIVHSSSLQPLIIQAASNLGAIDPTQEALMFSIYSISLMSMNSETCHSMFQMERDVLMKRFQLGAQQALVNCGFLGSEERDNLAALLLYLMSVRPRVAPQSLATMIGIALRIAKRMGINDEAVLAKRSIFEAEMSRRLWWALVLFDDRICQLAQLKDSALSPQWNCRVSLNINDSDLRPEMTEIPVIHKRPSEMIFSVVRSEIGNYVRYSSFYLDFSSKATTENFTHHSKTLDEFSERLKGQYLNTCNSHNPLHFITVRTAQSSLSTYQLIKYYSSRSISDVSSQKHDDMAMDNALTMLEIDTELMSSVISANYRWFTDLYFPLIAYIHILGRLNNHPMDHQAEGAWNSMNKNFNIRLKSTLGNETPFIKVLGHNILQAWAAREAVFAHCAEPLQPIEMISTIRLHRATKNSVIQSAGGELHGFFSNTQFDQYLPTMPADLSSYLVPPNVMISNFGYADHQNSAAGNSILDNLTSNTHDNYPLHQGTDTGQPFRS